MGVGAQRPALSPEQAREREQGWGGNLVWVFDGTEAYEAERLTLRRNPNRPPGDA